ncbi:glutamine amidotransferase [Aquabacter sp. CN5-332]|uniref:glutamine amidotransferase n=1 Tax=Aquabacter sp. CN5-332 TaxID=3156608 RepID=UPI0032B4CFD6
MPLSCVAIRHVAFEHLGTLGPLLAERGFEVRMLDAGAGRLDAHAPLDADLLIVLGGPVGVCEADRYPWIADELAILKRRLAAGGPTFGICLGAQMMAAALGAGVRPGPAKEIGWAPVELVAEAASSPLRHLEGVPVLHWHGDNLDLPDGALSLAATPLCPHQAFARGPNILGLQFHAEVDADEIEAWLIGHAAEIAAAGIDPRTLRADSAAHGQRLKTASRALFAEWLDAVNWNWR